MCRGWKLITEHVCDTGKKARLFLENVCMCFSKKFRESVEGISHICPFFSDLVAAAVVSVGIVFFLVCFPIFSVGCPTSSITCVSLRLCVALLSVFYQVSA